MKKLISAAEAAGMVKDGMTVMIGGFLGNGSPHAIIDALVESGVKDLTYGHEIEMYTVEQGEKRDKRQ